MRSLDTLRTSHVFGGEKNSMQLLQHNYLGKGLIIGWSNAREKEKEWRIDSPNFASFPSPLFVPQTFELVFPFLFPPAHSMIDKLNFLENIGEIYGALR